MKASQQRLIVLLFPLLAVGCGGGGGDSGDESSVGSGSSNLDITVRASNLAQQNSTTNTRQARAYPTSLQPLLPVACSAFFTPGPRGGSNELADAGPKTGSCLTPISVKGHVSSINLAGDYFGGGVRLLGGGSGFGQNYVVEGSTIDLADPLSLGGEDNAQDTGFSNVNNRLTTEFNYLDVAFAVPRSSETLEYWTYRYAFVSYPFSQEKIYEEHESTPGDVTFTDTSSTLADCVASDFLQAGDTADSNNSQLLGGISGVQKGDILICRKSSASASCAASDFQWLNLNTSTFVSTRPATDSEVFRFSRMAEHKVTCQPQSDGPGFSVNLGGFSLISALYNKLQFSADVEGSSKIYEFQHANDSTSYKKGSDMYLYVDLDFKNSLFVHDNSASNPQDMTLDGESDYSKYETLTDAQLAPMIWLKPVMLWENSSCQPWRPGDCQTVNTGVKANVGVELSGNTEHPVYICATDDGTDTDCVEVEPTSTEAQLAD